jgi:hypothetical protein
MSRQVAYLGVDAGPASTVAAIAAGLPGRKLDCAVSSAREFQAQLSQHEIELLVCGTSDSSHGREVERFGRAAAAAAGIPAVIVEDFPGNYFHVSAAPAEVVVVESEFAADLARVRNATTRSGIFVCPSVRYDPLRARLDGLRKSAPGLSTAMLWAGQPETRDCIATLARLAPPLAKHRVKFWFRAHPRDEGYRGGAYAPLLETAGLDFEDVSAEPMDSLFERRPALLVTQFSSAAIEAGFWGIPALHVLYPDAGAARLLEKKGYSTLPWCEAGAAFRVDSEEQTEAVLEQALRDRSARLSVLERFDRYFQVHSRGVPRLIEFLYNQRLL